MGMMSINIALNLVGGQSTVCGPSPARRCLQSGPRSSSEVSGLKWIPLWATNVYTIMVYNLARI